MKESKLKYCLINYNNTIGIVWETELGNVVIIQDKLDINYDLSIIDADSGEEVKNIDLRNILMSMLPQ